MKESGIGLTSPCCGSPAITAKEPQCSYLEFYSITQHETYSHGGDSMKNIETARLCLTLANDEEMEHVIAAENDAELKKAYGEMLHGAQEHPEIRELYAMWFIKLKGEPETVIGDMCFKGLSDDGMVEIGYGVYPNYENHGYATEAVMALVDWVIKRDGVKCIEAEAEESNAASLRVLEKCGFVANGKIGAEGPRFAMKS